MKYLLYIGAIVVVLVTTVALLDGQRSLKAPDSVVLQTPHSAPQSQPDIPSPTSAARPTVRPSATIPAPTVLAPTTTPSYIVVNTATFVTITTQITDPTLIAGSVNLLRLGATGTQPTILGIMHDDGLNGDAAGGDSIYTLRVTFSEATPGQVQLQVSAAFKGKLQRTLSTAVLLQVWNTLPLPAGSGLSSSIVYPPSWVPIASSDHPSDGVYFSPSSEEEAGQGISVALLNAPINSVLLDSGDVLVNQFSQTLDGRQWTFVIEQEPTSGLQFYHGFLQISSGVIVIGGTDSPASEAIINTMAASLNP